MRKYICTPIVVLIVLFLPACTYHVFHEPMAISTKSLPARNFQPIKTVKVDKCWYTILFPFYGDPRDMYDDLLDEAKKAGGTAVLDVQVSGTEGGFFWAIPPIGRDCFEAKGTAARYE